jgi:hypothetical protein
MSWGWCEEMMKTSQPPPLGCYDFFRTRTLNTAQKANGAQREALIAIPSSGMMVGFGLVRDKNRDSAERFSAEFLFTYEFARVVTRAE